MTNLLAPSPSEPSPPAPPYYNTLAVISLVSSFFVSLAAVITGHIALAQIHRTGERGRGLAIAGVVIGYLGIAFWTVVAGSFVIGSALGAVSGFRAFSLPVPPSAPPSAHSAPAPAPGPDPDAPADITFEDGNDLLPTISAQISDGMLGDRDWALSVPKANGTWGYASNDGTCSVTFHQGDLDTAVDVVPGDDLSTSENYLSALTGESFDDVDQYGRDDAISLGNPTDDVYVESWGISRSDENGQPHISVARAFAVAGTVVAIDVSCSTPEQTVDGYEHVLSRTGIVIS